MKIRQNGAAVQLEGKKMTTLIPVRIKWHGGRKKVIPAATLADQQPEHDASMLVALSRVVLGLHYPSDVLAGALLGSGLATLVLQF